MRSTTRVLALCLLASCGGGAGTSPSSATAATPTPSSTVAASGARFKAQVWADNWFALYSGDTLVGQDSVPITTERSFNSETFTFAGTYPLELNTIIKDYKENDSGLEYIGLSNQQMGDGGFIMQITDTVTNRIVAVSSSAFRCLVIHKAPLNPSCERSATPLTACQFRADPEPSGWKSPGFNTTGWETATVYTPAQIGVKEGYNDIAWDASAKLIWTSDLKTDNTLLCKLTVTGN